MYKQRSRLYRNFNFAHLAVAGGMAAKAAKDYQRSKSKRLPVSTKVSFNDGKSSYTKKYKKPKYKPKGFKKTALKIKSLDKRVKKLSRSAEADKGKLTFRQRSTGRVLSTVNNANYFDVSAFTTGFYETVLAQLRYYDPSTPATLVQADGATGTFMKDFLFAKLYAKLSVRNNYQVPVSVVIYSCKVKDDTSIAPSTAFTNGLADVGNPSSISPLVYPTDSPQFTDLWHTVSSKRVILQPGSQCLVSFKNITFQYDPSLIDSHPPSFQRRYGGFSFLLRVEGVLGHDTVADEQGILASGIDWCLDRTAIVEYSAGADIEYVYVTDGSDTFTNGGVVSSKPVSDNIGYSVA